MKYTASESLSLLEALGHLSPTSSKTTLRSWIKEGRALIDGAVTKGAQSIVQPGQTVSLGQRKKFIEGNINVIYEDDDLIIVDKPCGMLSVSTAFEKGETVHAYLKAYYKPRKVYVIHRLDQDTSGALVFAFNERTYEKLKKMFEVHDIERGYVALVEGKLSSRSGTWSSYLYEDEFYKVHPTDDPEQGKLAITHYTVRAAAKHYSLLDIKLETGRKNQIRVHCQQAGHSVVGDRKYGAKTNPIKRLGLHAYLLAFKHPTSYKEMRFESPIPEAFHRVIKAK